MENNPPMKTLKMDLTLGAFPKKAPKTASYSNYICMIIYILICTKALVYHNPKSFRTENDEKYITLSMLLRKLKQ